MLFVVGFHSLFESSQSVVAFLIDGHVNLSRGSPEHYNALNTAFFLEVADVFAELLNHFPAGLAVHDVVAVKTFSVVVVESCSEGHDFLEFVAYGLDVLLFEDFGVHCRFVCVCGVNVPCGKDDVFEIGDGSDFVVFQIFFVSAFTHTDFVVLSHGANGFGKAFASHQNTGNEGGRYSAEAYDHHAEFTGCRFCFSFAHFG